MVQQRSDGIDTSETAPEVTVQELPADTADRLIIDVREPDEFRSGHVPGAENLPLAEIGFATERLVGKGVVFVICQSGNRSLRAATTLRLSGVDAVSVTGGTVAWRKAGGPLE